jgi:3-hydroxybutyryl-CoA dehydratase
MANPIRESAIKGLREGDSFSYERVFTQEETAWFGDLTRDYNPVHYDLRWAGAKGFNGLICHGLLVGSMICEFGGQVGWLASGMNFKFIKPVYFGDTVHCTITVTKIQDSGRAEAEAVFNNQNGEQVCYAHLKGRLPLGRERDLLRRMITEGDTTNKLSDETYRQE